jgi:hypothetical protein
LEKENSKNLTTGLVDQDYSSNRVTKLPMKYIVKIIYIVFAFLLFYYLAIPNFNFPAKLLDSLQSKELADSEDNNRRAYFTNLERNEVLSYYQYELSSYFPFNLNFLTFRLNYPPEEAGILIRDQTRSTFLEEIVHPLRESFYVNGFKPKLDKDAIHIDGKDWVEKITVRFVSSNFFVRILIGIFVLIAIPLVYLQSVSVFTDLVKVTKKIWTSQ